jgi:hypothetical protein
MKTALCMLAGALGAIAAAQAAAQSVVVPYGDTDIAIEFVNDDGAFRHTVGRRETAMLAGGAYGVGWRSTGAVWRVWLEPAAGRVPMCRLGSTAFGALASKVYTPYMSECAQPKSAPTAWQFETVAYFVALPDATGRCAPGSEALYRLYNVDAAGVPQHRYTTDASERAALAVAGWTAEGNGEDVVFACTPKLLVGIADVAAPPSVDVPGGTGPAAGDGEAIVHVGPGIPLVPKPR